MRIRNEEKFLNRLRSDLKNTNNFVWIEKFAYRFSDFYSEQDLKKLNEFFLKKGLYSSEYYLKILVDEEIKKQHYVNFKSKITYNNPQTLKEYLKNLMDVYGVNYENYLQILEQYLEEISFFDYEIDYYFVISNLANEIKKEEEMLNFEEELKYTTETGISPFISINEIDQLDGYRFEGLLKVLFEKMGYIVVNTPLSGDQGADLILSRFNEKIVVQAKRYNEKVANKAVQEVVGSIAYYKANKGIVVTNSEFTESAIELGNSNHIELIDRFKLQKLIEQYHIHKEEF